MLNILWWSELSKMECNKFSAPESKPLLIQQPNNSIGLDGF